MDNFKAKGEIKTAFIICGVTIVVLMVAHTFSMIFIDEIKEEEIVTPPVTNESIKRQRQMAYRMRADQYLIAYQAYTELGEHEKASEMKELWI